MFSHGICFDGFQNSNFLNNTPSHSISLVRGGFSNSQFQNIGGRGGEWKKKNCEKIEGLNGSAKYNELRH